ncbi:MAG TPA: hypothetical protein VHS33_03010 [Sphingomicrobium sp.]|jgi:hypothetical protein|nr:hypothetical protein [Sphingomicrobium sp.]
MRNSTLALAVLAFVAGSTASQAKTVEAGTPAQVQRLMACRNIPAPDQRLACYDRETEAVNQAIANKDLFMVDKERARAAGRSLFGFSIPNFGGLFGSNGEVSQIDSAIKSAGHNSDGGWLITLSDGSVWTQTDDWPGFDARPGAKVTVKRGVLGSFWLSSPGKDGIKVKRVG